MIKQHNNYVIHDVTLRDGNHALRHGLLIDQAVTYASRAYKSGIKSLEVGHGNGLGASSALVGFSKVEETKLLEKVREAVPDAILGVHSIPAFSTIKKNLIPALNIGIDSFRVAAHCTEMNTTLKHIEFIKSHNKDVTGTLMMITHTSISNLISESLKLIHYGADKIAFMDSVGGYTPIDVKELMDKCSDELSVPFGFHAHNNLNLAVWNSITAIKSGASFIDASILGLGAGAGNTQLESLIAVMKILDLKNDLDSFKIIKLANFCSEELGFPSPIISAKSVASSMNNIFSGFLPIIKDAANKNGVSEIDLIFSLSEANLVAGQEDLIYRKANEVKT